MIQNDMDLWSAALDKCNLSKAVLPTSRGYLIENVECYNKMQAILNAPEMEHCHKYVLNLDAEDLEEDEIQKIDELYALGQDRGFIPPDEPEEPADGAVPDDAVVAADLAAQAVEPPPAAVPAATPAPVASYTVMYSAMKDGQIKTGEAYSNAISPRAAKADVLAKLSQVGYDNISVLAIEASDPDCVSVQPQAPAIGQVGAPISDSSIEEADKKDDEPEAAEDKPEDAEQPEDGEEKKEELTPTQKATLRDAYKKAFKEAMISCKFDGMKFDDLTIEQKVELFTKLQSSWSGKADPSEFMSQDDTDDLNSTVMKA